MNGNDDGGWGDMFALAAGGASSSHNPTDPVSKEEAPKKKKRKEKKRKRKRETKDAEFLEMIEKRMSPSVATAVVSTGGSDTSEWHMHAYRTLQSLRSSAFLEALGRVDAEMDHRGNVRNVAKISFPSSLDQGEVVILQTKKQHLLDCSAFKRSFESSVRVVMACDDFYLRIYYLQVSGALSSPYLPHPVSYFGDAASGKAAETLQKLKQLCKKHAAVSLYYGLDVEDSTHHVLSKIHQQRLVESHLLFDAHDVDGTVTLRELNRTVSLDRFSLEYHETPASPLLAEWRDSCRDVLCNLYCYATLSPTTIRNLTKALHGVKSITELGAGTGYLAKVLQTGLLDVHPYDIDPPSANVLNDYHGRTRPFVEVKKGTSSTVLRASALLLCYPPPQVPMAHAAIQECTSGDYVIHVGEWKGLTGCAQFEQELMQQFHCIFREPCLTWGTDCSEVTVWKRDGDTPSQQSLIPCLQCQTKEATRRCRLLRQAVYCSQECFQQHRQTFKVMCRLSLVPVAMVDLVEFSNEKHFRSLDPTASAAKDTKPKKKRRTK